MNVNGLLNTSFWGYLAYTLIATHITIAAVTIFLHRHQAHRALELHPVVSHFFRFWLWLTTGMVTKEWVSVHRKHHAKCETAEDPHSPQVKGIRKVLWQGTELYRAEIKNPETVKKYGLGTPNDWLERKVYTPYNYMGVTILLFIDLALFGFIGLTVWAIQMIWIPFWAAGVINGIGHWWGYRNYETTDASTNIFPIGVLIGGEEFHNNHHSFASSAKLANKWWEFDIGWMYIRLLSFFRLAKIKRVVTKPVMGPIKPFLDMDTARAIVNHRFQVMSHYCSKVIFPVLTDELHKADDSCRRMFKRAKGLLVREESLLDEEAKQRLVNVLNRSKALETVYQYKQNLQDLWKRSSGTPESLVHSLQEWCKQAEQTGIKSLQDFAKTLRRYSLQGA
jgi:stearoyl-CoA desaturase (delta-9 desaturase)